VQSSSLLYETGSAHSRLLENGWPCPQASRDCGVSAQPAPPDEFLITDAAAEVEVNLKGGGATTIS